MSMTRLMKGSTASAAVLGALLALSPSPAIAGHRDSPSAPHLTVNAGPVQQAHVPLAKKPDPGTSTIEMPSAALVGIGLIPPLALVAIRRRRRKR